MPTIGSLNVTLGATTGLFTRNMMRATSTVRNFSTSAVATASRVATLGGALVTVAAGAGMGALVKSSMEAMDVTAKVADRLGATTEGLQGLRHAANLAGASQETLDKSLEYMTRRLGEAREGSGETVKAFEKLGVNFDELAAMDPSRAFGIISDAINALPTAADRASVAVDIFGRSGVQLLNTMQLGSEGLASATEEAKKLGIAFTRLDAAKVELANDAMTKLGQTFVGVANSIAIQLSPFITHLADQFTATATAGDGMGSRVAGAFEWMGKSIAAAMDWLELPIAGFYALQSGATLAILGVVGAIDMLGQAVVELVNLLPGAQMEFTRFFGDLADGLLIDIDKSMGKAADHFDRFMTGANSSAVKNTFAEIRANAEAAAQAITDSAPSNFAGAGDSLASSSANSSLSKSLVAGSAEAISFINQSQSSTRLSGQEKLARTAEDQLAETRRQTSLLQEIADGTAGGGDFDVVDF